MTSTLYRNGRVYTHANPTASAFLVRDGVVDWLGPSDEAPSADTTVDLDGALVTPAFVDAHLHATDTGLALDGLDLSAVRSAAELLDAVAAHAAARPGAAVVLGHGWDESAWTDRRKPTAAQLDRAVAGRPAYLTQASVHSALCSTALLDAAPRARSEPGFDEDGWLREEAHHAVREVALSSLSAAQRAEAQRVALRRAAALGIAAVCECGGPGTSGEDDFTDLLKLSGQGLPEVYGYWGELMAAGKARELGAVGAGGDLYADGALGSQTARLSEPYRDAEGRGFAYVTAAQARDHLLDCAAHAMQGGFHAIGDEAVATVVAGFASAAATIGVDRVRAGRHRVEHAEIVDKRLIAAFVEYGVVASVQPAFDRLWGGEHQMYAQRLGVARALESNPFGAMHGIGVTLAFGSDSPVTPLDPWGTVRAAAHHFNPAHRMTVRAAFAAHTRGGWRAVHRDHEGTIGPGAPATFAVWSVPGDLAGGLPTVSAEQELPTCRRTVLRGETIYEG
jgi:predicted amidohydrolase YtcJ